MRLYCTYISKSLFIPTLHTLLNTCAHARLIWFGVHKQITCILNQLSDYIIPVRFSHSTAVTAICWEFIQ